MARRSRTKARAAAAMREHRPVLNGLDVLQDLAERRRQLRSELDRALIDARDWGRTFDEIAGAMGVSRQAAISAHRRAVERLS